MTTARELLQEARGWLTAIELCDRIDAFLAQPEPEPKVKPEPEPSARVPINPSQEWFDHVANALHISDADVKAMHDAFLYAVQPEPKSIHFCECDEQATKQELDTLKCSACGGRLL